MAIGSFCFAIQLWWEVQPRVSEVISVIRNGLGKEQEVKDEEGGVSRTGYNVEHIQSHEQSAKVTVPCESGEDCCRKDREALFSDSMLAREAEAETVRGRLLSVWEEVSKNWPAAQVNSPLGQDLEMNVERRPNEEGLFDAALKNLLEVGRPTVASSKGPNQVGRSDSKVLFGARACRGCHDVDCGRPDGDVLGIQLGSSPPALNLTELTDEALMEEASKDTTSYPRALFLLGKWDFSSSSILSRRDGVIVATDGSRGRDCSLETVGGTDLDPLRMILADGREAEVSGFSGMANEVVEEEIKDVSERAFQEVMEEGNEAGEPCWQSSCLAKFSRCLGMPTEGFEGEILFLLKRMKERKLQKGKLDGRKKKKLESSKFERELRKLEWTVNYIGGGGEGGIVFSGLDEDLYAFLECKRGK